MTAQAVTIRERILDALHRAGPAGLTMAAVAGVVTGPWRERDVEATVRKLWEINQLARRSDGTFVPTGRSSSVQTTEMARNGRRAAARMDAAVKRVADAGRRDGYSAKLTVRTVDPALLSAWCAGCRRTVHPRLDGVCPTCGHQTGANQEPPAPARRPRRRRPLKQGDRWFGPVCKCGAAKSRQAHACASCSRRRRRGRKLARNPNDARGPRAITDELLLEARRLYATGLSLRQVAAEIHSRTMYKTQASCAKGLYSLFRTRGWKLRPQSEVTRARSTKHGRKARGLSAEKEQAYRRWLAQQRGWKRLTRAGQPACKGVKKQSPNKGKPCERPAMEGSDYCYSHDPKLELERQVHLKRMRANAGYRELLLPVTPFAAWLEQRLAELGSWRDVAALIGCDQSQTHRWGTGQTQRVAARVVERVAAAAGVPVETIYPDRIKELAAA